MVFTSRRGRYITCEMTTDAFVGGMRCAACVDCISAYVRARMALQYGAHMLRMHMPHGRAAVVPMASRVGNAGMG